MTRDELLKILKGFDNEEDCEFNHSEADSALLEFINDKEISEAYDEITRWSA